MVAGARVALVDAQKESEGNQKGYAGIGGDQEEEERTWLWSMPMPMAMVAHIIPKPPLASPRIHACWAARRALDDMPAW